MGGYQGVFRATLGGCWDVDGCLGGFQGFSMVF